MKFVAQHEMLTNIILQNILLIILQILSKFLNDSFLRITDIIIVDLQMAYTVYSRCKRLISELEFLLLNRISLMLKGLNIISSIGAVRKCIKNLYLYRISLRSSVTISRVDCICHILTHGV